MESETGSFCCELSQHTLLALFTEMLAEQKPHSRSVYVAREQLENSTEPPALLVIEGLEFVLYLATEGDIDRDTLAEWMMSNYCYQHYERKHFDTGAMEAHARHLCIQRPFPDLEERWRGMASDDERAVHFLALEQSETAEQLLDGMLSLYRENRVSEVTQQCLERNVALYAEYKRLKKKNQATMAAVKEEMKVDPFFFIKSVHALAVEKSWPVAAKLAGQRVWAVTFDNHTILEHFVDKLRYPIEVGGQLYPHRVEGRKIGVTVLEMSPQGELQVFNRRGTIPHDYTLRQTPALGKRWHFNDCKRQLNGGVLTAALETKNGVRCGLLGEDPFTTVCKLAQRNDTRVSSNLAPLKLTWLDSAVLLVDARHHTESKKPVSLCDALKPQQVKKTEPGPTPTLKRKLDDDDVFIVGTSAAAATKKTKYNGTKPLVQARLINFTTYEKPRH